MDRSDYIQLMYAFLQDVNATIVKFSLRSYNESVRSAISSSFYVIPTNTKNLLYKMHYSIPPLYGQLKTHKENLPIRPVVASYTNPAFLLSKFLASYFTDVTSFEALYSIKKLDHARQRSGVSSLYSWLQICFLQYPQYVHLHPCRYRGRCHV